MTASQYPRVPLGEVIERKSAWVTLDPDTDYRQVTVRLWGQGVALRGITKGSAIAAEKQIRIRAGQFIMSRIDARHGAFGIVPESLDGAVVSQDFPVFEARQDRLLPEFLGWISKAEWFIALCKTASEGSTNRVRLKEDRFLRHTIPLPSIPEQRRIMSQLKAIAGFVENRGSTATVIETELNSALLATFLQTTSGAPRVRLGAIAPLVRRDVEIDPEASYPELGIRSFGKGTFHKPAVEGLNVGTRTLYRIEAGDLLFNITFAWEGAVAVATDNDDGRFASHRFLTLVPARDRATAAFLRYYFLSPEGLGKLVALSPGSAGRNRVLSLKKLLALEIPLPTLETQEWFDMLQAAAEKAHARSEAAAGELGCLIPAMLQEEISPA